MATAYQLPDLPPVPRLPIAAGSLAATYAAAKPTLAAVSEPTHPLGIFDADSLDADILEAYERIRAHRIWAYAQEDLNRGDWPAGDAERQDDEQARLEKLIEQTEPRTIPGLVARISLSIPRLDTKRWVDRELMGRGLLALDTRRGQLGDKAHKALANAVMLVGVAWRDARDFWFAGASGGAAADKACTRLIRTLAPDIESIALKREVAAGQGRSTEAVPWIVRDEAYVAGAALSQDAEASAQAKGLARVVTATEALVSACREHLSPAFRETFLRWSRMEAVAWTRGGTDDDDAMEDRGRRMDAFSAAPTSNIHELALKVCAISAEALDVAHLGSFPSVLDGTVYNIDRLGFSLLDDVRGLSPLPNLINMLGRTAVEVSGSQSAWSPEVGAAVIRVLDAAIARPSLHLSSSFSAALADYRAARLAERACLDPQSLEEEHLQDATFKRTQIEFDRLMTFKPSGPAEAAELLSAVSQTCDLGGTGCDHRALTSVIDTVVRFVRQEAAA